MSDWAIAEVVGLLPHASNATLLAVTESGDFVVYKPAKGERPLWDFTLGTLPLREVLTSEVDAAMGLGVVPETRLIEGPHGLGSAQRFVPEDPQFDLRTLFEPELDERLWEIALLDIVCDNADRKVGHLLKEDGADRIWAIDNSLTFNEDEKLRTVLWGFAGQQVPSRLDEALVGLGAHLDALHARIDELLTTEEADVFLARATAIIDDPVHPMPPTDRPPVPWPVW
ncbi:MAG: phosphatidylinositol kinase [Acidimicrobiia bacterium]|nr:phosphatidylinositol kinase [Acidimicrobiia bacterium]